MSTVTAEKLKYLWVAYFSSQDVLVQPEDDRYSKHDDAAEHNPSAFRDILDREAKGMRLNSFHLMPSDDDRSLIEYSVNLLSGLFTIAGRTFSVHGQNVVPADLKLIFFREVRQETIGGIPRERYISRYFLGWEGRDLVTGDKIKHTIGIS